MASSWATITVSRSLIRPALPRFLAYRMHHFDNNKWTNASGIVASRLSRFHTTHASPSHLPLSAMTTPQDTVSPPTKTVRVVIKGKVQGVWYRNWTVDTATQLGLKGWVRNRKDGSVEALFSGTPDAVQEMQHRCRRGPTYAVVTALEVFPSDEDPGTGFEGRPTV